MSYMQREVSYDEWENVIDTISDFLEKFVKMQNGDVGDYLLVQDWDGFPRISVILIKMQLTQEFINEVIIVLKKFKPDWIVGVSFYDDSLKWMDCDFVAISNNGWYPIDQYFNPIKLKNNSL